MSNITARLITVIGFLTLAHGSTSLTAQGSTYYVATTGNDDNAGTESSPWRTLSKAARTLAGGQTALVHGGTYNERGIAFSSSGSPDRPITIRAFPGENPIVDGGFTRSSGAIPVFAIDGPDYITLDGLTIQRGSGANVFISQNSPSIGITIQNCQLLDVVTDDNAAAIYINTGSDEIAIQNNYIAGRTLGGSYNSVGSGVIIFNAQDLTISNNEFADLVHGIYYKHSKSTSHSTTIQRNLIHNMTETGIQWSRRDSIIQHNVIYSASWVGIRLFEEGAGCESLVTSGNQILHNTIVDSGTAVMLARSSSCQGAVDTTLRDNVFSNFTNGEFRGVAIHPYFSTDSSRTILDRNVIYASAFPSPLRVANSYHALSGLPSSVLASGNIQSAPVYQDYTGRRFALAPGPGKGTASDGGDMGAHVCTVGINASCSSTMPTAPRNLRITP